MTKLYAQEKQVFDINKVTVVGSPTISESGVASGFSNGNNYIRIPFTFNTTSTYKIQLIMETPSNPITNGYLFGGSGQFFEIYCQSNAFDFYYRDNTNKAKNINKYGFQPDTKYHIYCEFNLSTLNIAFGVKKDGDTDYQIYSTVMSSYLTPTTITNLGNTNNQYSIDLTALKIYVDGALVYSPTKPVYALERRKEGFDLSKFTVVGSPTITEYGVASGFSSGLNYIETSTAIDFSKPFEIYSSFQLNNLASSACVLWKILGSAYDNNLVVRPSSNAINIALRINNTLVTVGVGAFSFATNLIYNTVLGWDGAKYYLKIRAENETKWKEGSVLSDLPIDVSSSRQIVTIGKMPSEPNINFTGSIDLPSISITVDGKEVFTGAKEKFYAMRGM